MPKTRAAAKTGLRVQPRLAGLVRDGGDYGGVNASAAEALRPRLFGRVHVRTGLAAGGRPLPDNVGAENPLILKRSVHGDGFFVIFSQINLLLLKFGFSASAGEAQERIRIFQET